ncbi:MAG: LysM peptidoglycan-binding domain-containing protein [Elusimicrobia bacterium]|nr:LysM peptidoglycan-binding domain-containing protein [Elusimicrobiota bacterium]
MIRCLGLWAIILAGSSRAVEIKLQNVKVKPGDSLWGIAQTYLKDPTKWDEILKHNKMPSSDPTVPLPGMTLRVPVELIKEELRAAHLIFVQRRVDFRRKETAAWNHAAQDMELFKGDGLRTLDRSKAKVKFLNSELLSLDPNSMAIIKPLRKDYDVELKSGGLFVGRSRVVTASARITPRTNDTQYSAKVSPDLTTLVEVYTGVAAVEGQGKTVDVKAGMASEVKMGLAPGVPFSIPDLPQFEARAAAFTGAQVSGQARIRNRAVLGQLPVGAGADEINAALDADELSGEVANLSIGVPISGYRVQASRSRAFDKILLDKRFEAEEKINLNTLGLPQGVYWWRIALIDLLGTEAAFSSPKLFSVGLGRKPGGLDLKTALVVFKPSADEAVSTEEYRVSGLIRDITLNVTVNGKPARVDESGNFLADVPLQPGLNNISVAASDSSGNRTTVTRVVTRR